MTNEETVRSLRHLKIQTGGIQCLGCGYEHDCSIHWCRIMREAADLIEQQAAGIEELREKVPEWIPVTKRLPELEQRALILDKHGNAMVRTLRRFASEKEPSFRPDGLLPKVHITHWMPLPGLL